MPETALPPADKRKLFERLGKEIRVKLDRSPPVYWRYILETAGILAVIEKPRAASFSAEPTLEDAEEDDWEAMKRISIKAMKEGMQAQNAQMVRAFLIAEEARQGVKEIEGLTIKVVPATVPDEMADFLLQAIKELTEIASRS